MSALQLQLPRLQRAPKWHDELFPMQSKFFYTFVNNEREGKDLICLECDKDCIECKDKVGCSKCAEGFYSYQPSPNSAGLQCRICDKNCEKCEDGVGCKKCLRNFFTQHDVSPYYNYFKCSECDPNCNDGDCYDQVGCVVCKEGFFSNPNRKVDHNYSCLACGRGCSSCTSLMSCSQCNEGYQLSQGSCYACQITNCKACQKSTTQCSKCKEGFKSVSILGINERCSDSSVVYYLISILVIILILIAFIVVGYIVSLYLFPRGTDQAQANDDAANLNTREDLTATLT